ncbi:Nucleoside phosphorylase, partial [Metarhizium majus ARSEF 297]
MAPALPHLDNSKYTVGWIAALPHEMAAAEAMLDETHASPQERHEKDDNIYVLGSVYCKSRPHHVVIAGLPLGQCGNTAATTAANQMLSSFPAIKFGLMVGIGGGIWSERNDIRLGDVVRPSMKQPRSGTGFVHQGTSNDQLFRSDYRHQTKAENCDACDKTGEIARKERPDCDPFVHYGTIASGDMIIKNPQTRDLLGQDCLCFETEAAGLMNDFPCLVIRGISDYCDSHKNDQWQNYAAATAAAYAKELLLVIDPAAMDKTPRAIDVPSILEQVTRVQEEVTEGLQSVRQGQERKDRHDIREWITHIDYGHQYSDILKRRWEGTGQWMLDSTEFKNWLESKGKTLFCSGIPGAGKTVLSAIVVDHLCGKFGQDSSIGIAWLFCEYHRHNEQTLEHLLSSLLKQLLKQQTTLPNCVTELYELHQRRTTRPSINDIAKPDILRDGAKMNIFATSRHIDSIQSKFSGCVSLEIKAADEDIRMYLRGQRRRFTQDMVNDELQARIESKVVKASANMVLLAAFHMNRLVELKTSQDMINFLESIQGRDLDAAYKKTMEIIENQDQNSVSLAKTDLGLDNLRQKVILGQGASACARREVKIDSYTDMIDSVHYTTFEILQQTRPDWLQDMQADLAETCLTYLLYDCFRVGSCRADQAFEAEFDFYEYAAANWAHHAGIGRSSKASLARKEKIQLLLDGFLATDSLPPSFLYWLFRLKKHIIHDIDDSPPEDSYQLISISNETFATSYRRERFTWSSDKMTFAVLEALITASLERSRLVLAPCPHPEHWHNLSSSAFEGRPPRCLDDGALGCKKSCTPEAVENLKRWKKKISELLVQVVDEDELTKKARRQNPPPEEIRAMFSRDTFSREFSRYRFLHHKFSIIEKPDVSSLTTDPHVETRDFTEWLPFFENHDAPQRCLEEIANLTVILLLKTKAGFKGWTKEEEELFRRLLLKPVHKYQEYQYIPADFLDQDPVLLDVIHLGCGALDFLVRSGVDVNETFRGHPLGTALVAAVVDDLESKAPCVEYLLKHGADSNQPTNGREYGSALVAACALGRMDALNLLLQQPNIWVKMEVKFDSYGTALIAACAKGNIDALHLLLQQPNVEVAMATEFGRYGTPFIAACANGRMDALHLLLQQPNVEVNMATQFGCYGTALIAACSNTRVVLDENETMATTVKYLLEKGAHVNHSTIGEARAKYVTALAAAVHGGIPRIVQTLLNSGAIADERVKNDMPSDSSTARHRWDCLRFQVSHPNTEGTELVRTCMDKEWIDQCTLEARQLSMAIIYSLLEVDAPWAEEYIPQALYYLRAFSSRWMESLDRFAAAQITLQQFGFGGKDLHGKMLLFLQNELRADDQEWNRVVACLKELILEFEEGKIPPLRQIEADNFDPHFDLLPYSDISDEILSEPE